MAANYSDSDSDFELPSPLKKKKRTRAAGTAKGQKEVANLYQL